MGLDTSFDAWHGPYSAFSRWREALEEVAWQGDSPIDWGHVTGENLMGVWESTPADPLVVLIAHSDCEGEIRPEQAGPLADRLEGLLPALSGDLGGHVGYVRERTERFIAGLRAAIAAGEPVDFH